MFFIFLFFFRFLFFLFVLKSFKKVSLLRFVSEFDERCFLRGRCSMEMWCADDTGQDSWDWVGPPTWESMIQLLQNGVEAARLLKTEPRQVVLLLLFLTMVNEMRSLLSTKHHGLVVQELGHRGLPKKSGTQIHEEESENGANTDEKKKRQAAITSSSS